MKSARVLVIDNDKRLARALGESLVGAGFDATVAHDGEKGLQAFAAEVHDVVVTDVIMPERDGLETVRAIKASEPEVKVIAMSRGGRIGAQPFLDLADRMGADATLAKPFPVADLVALVQKMVASRVDR